MRVRVVFTVPWQDVSTQASEQSPGGRCHALLCGAHRNRSRGGRRHRSATPSGWQGLSPPGRRVGIRVRPPDSPFLCCTAVQLDRTGRAVGSLLEAGALERVLMAGSRPTLFSALRGDLQVRQAAIRRSATRQAMRWAGKNPNDWPPVCLAVPLLVLGLSSNSASDRLEGDVLPSPDHRVLSASRYASVILCSALARHRQPRIGPNKPTRS